jgi:DNA repair exonuclease SbcCD ATPase subunit
MTIVTWGYLEMTTMNNENETPKPEIPPVEEPAEELDFEAPPPDEVPVEEEEAQAPPLEEPAIEEPAEPEPEPESRSRRFARLAFRWTLGVLIVFGLGFLTALLTLYQPATQNLDRAESQVADLEAEVSRLSPLEEANRSLQDELEQALANLDDAEDRIAELEAEVSRLTPLGEDNQRLQAELEDAELHVHILSAKADVAEAHLALIQESTADARVILNDTADTLEALVDMLASDQQEVVADMQERLELVLSEIGDDPFAARSDLEVLAVKLTQLENAFFTGP